jgi:hypothetical protein
MFAEIGKGGESRAAPRKVLGADGHTIFVMHAEGEAAFETSNAGFAAALKPDCTGVSSAIPDQRDNTIFLAVVLPNACLREKDG